MRYMMLIYSRETPSTPEQQRGVVLRHRDVMSEAREQAIFQGAEPLEPTTTAVTVRKKGDGKMLVTDGPFAETKEQLGGFFLISARDLNEAIQVASKFPSVRFGTMEVRPVREIPGSGRAAEAL